MRPDEMTGLATTGAVVGFCPVTESTEDVLVAAIFGTPVQLVASSGWREATAAAQLKPIAGASFIALRDMP